MLMGKTKNSIDAKNRMIIPSKYRKELGYSCVLTCGIEKCLYIYPLDMWESFREKLAKLPTSDPKARAFIRHFYANAVECEIDKQGRMVIPQELKAYAGIEKEMVTVGLIDKIEIWSSSEWDKEENGTQMNQDDFAKAMIEYGI